MDLQARFTAAVADGYGRKCRTFARNSSYAVPGYDVDDMEQEMLVVLFQCVEKYDPSKGAKFNTYFTHIAKQRISSLIRHHKALKRCPAGAVVWLEDEAVRNMVDETLRGDSAEEEALANIAVAERLVSGGRRSTRREAAQSA